MVWIGFANWPDKASTGLALWSRWRQSLCGGNPRYWDHVVRQVLRPDLAWPAAASRIDLNETVCCNCSFRWPGECLAVMADGREEPSWSIHVTSSLYNRCQIWNTDLLQSPLMYRIHTLLIWSTGSNKSQARIETTSQILVHQNLKQQSYLPPQGSHQVVVHHPIKNTIKKYKQPTLPRWPT